MPSKFMSCSKKKKIKSFCKTKYPTKERVKIHKRKMNEWTDDDNSVYICEDLAYNIIRYINLDVIKADEFRKNLGVKNDQSIRIEREIRAIIMKVFATEIMVRQY